jgi:hypothetical protein
MAEANSATWELPAEPTWRRVGELADLVEIFDPGVQVCSWQRRIDPAIAAYLSQLQHKHELQIIETLSPAAGPVLGDLPGGPGRESLMADIALLGEIVR